MGRCKGKEMEDRKLKIAMLGHKRIPSREGGIEIVVEELCTRMAELGHDVTCYNRKGHHVSGKDFDKEVSDITGVRASNIARFEKASRVPTLLMLEKYANALEKHIEIRITEDKQ